MKSYSTDWLRLGALPAFIILFATMYAAFGVASPYWPRFFESRGLKPEQLGLLLGLGIMMRLVAGPLVGRIADLVGALRAALATCAACAAAAALGLLTTKEFELLMVIHIGQAAALAPTTTLADALALNSASCGSRRNFEYGWVRGSASAAFIMGTLIAGQLLNSAELGAMVWVHAGLLTCTVLAAALVPGLSVKKSPVPIKKPSVFGGVRELLGNPVFRRVVLVAALISGSHALHDTFAVIRWNAAGIGSGPISFLWSASVAAEVLVFFWIGPGLLDRLGPGGAATLAAVAGIIRWIVMSQTAALVALVLVQPLHGFTFALLHLACMRLIATVVTPRLAATAQAFYAFGVGSATALTMLSSGYLYARLSSNAFLLMALLCTAALPMTLRLQRIGRNTEGATSAI